MIAYLNEESGREIAGLRIMNISMALGAHLKKLLIIFDFELTTFSIANTFDNTNRNTVITERPYLLVLFNSGVLVERSM